MIDPDLIRVGVAFVVTCVTATIAVVGGTRSELSEHSVERDAPPETAVATSTAVAAAGGSQRPRIFTGEEPTRPEPSRSPGVRAVRLVSGVAVLAALAALALMAFARALILLFERIGD